MVLVAQNHRYMTDDDNKAENEKFWPHISEALERGVNVDIVGMHPEVNPPKINSEKIPDALSLWAHYMSAPAFFDHVRSSWDSLKIWSDNYKNQKAEFEGALRIFGAYFTPITINAVDPELNSGFMVISPRPANEANQLRPQFVVYKKSSPDTFDYYWATIKNSFDNASWKRMYNDHTNK